MRGRVLAACLVTASGCGLEPVSPSPVGEWVEVAVGAAHICAVLEGGTTRCWGSNDRGQTGSGDGLWIPEPTDVAVPFGLRGLTAGGRHSCGLDSTGNAWCWGANDLGQLGDGSTQDRSRPVRVATGGQFSEIVAGWEHTCAVRLDGRALCWGANAQGQSGIGLASSEGVPPTPVDSKGGLGTVAAGRAHGCAITTGGVAVCWGRGSTGALGSGTLVDSPRPTRVSLPTTLHGISAGAEHTCAVDRDGLGWCWGDNTFGQVGRDEKKLHGTPVLRDGGSLVSIGVGEGWTCALQNVGTVRCWGLRWDDRTAGSPGFDSRGWLPVAPNGRFVRLAVGARQACAIDDSNGMRCWGRGTF